MRFVDRKAVAEPESLSRPSDAVAREMQAVADYYKDFDPEAKDARAYEPKQYKALDVKAALRILFDHKCAYCETAVGDGLEVEHFRPKGRVDGEPAHSGYWWLAHAWTNLLPSCAGCNKALRQHAIDETTTIDMFNRLLAKRGSELLGKANQFPIGGKRAFCRKDKLEAEDPYLIDPTATDPEPHLRWSHAGDYSVVLPGSVGGDESPYGRATIRTFALNRQTVVQDRTSKLTVLRFERVRILEDLKRDSADPAMSTQALDRAIRRAQDMRDSNGPGQPFSAMTRAFVDAFLAELKDPAAPTAMEAMAADRQD